MNPFEPTSETPAHETPRLSELFLQCGTHGWLLVGEIDVNSSNKRSLVVFWEREADARVWARIVRALNKNTKVEIRAFGDRYYSRYVDVQWYADDTRDISFYSPQLSWF